MLAGTLEKQKCYDIVLYVTLPELSRLRRIYGASHIRYRRENGKLIGLVSCRFKYADSLRDKYSDRHAQEHYSVWWQEYEAQQDERQYMGEEPMDAEAYLAAFPEYMLEPEYPSLPEADMKDIKRRFA
ncbi:hypothetical protein [Thalassospira lucentensis]|uniref:hypothetical protein n=1 Tax=Thalassospira lucentensis TaxID=168935 RepID=UPI002943AAC7|nr:hypothetical protein [Thalassospira lucentensis]WOI09074.1 hypothetical protein R1T41_00335 [Thalassospira lucentensis]